MNGIMKALYYTYFYIYRIVQDRALYREQPLYSTFASIELLHYVPRNVSRKMG